MGGPNQVGKVVMTFPFDVSLTLKADSLVGWPNNFQML